MPNTLALSPVPSLAHCPAIVGYSRNGGLMPCQLFPECTAGWWQIKQGAGEDEAAAGGEDDDAARPLSDAWPIADTLTRRLKKLVECICKFHASSTSHKGVAVPIATALSAHAKPGVATTTTTNPTRKFLDVTPPVQVRAKHEIWMLFDRARCPWR